MKKISGKILKLIISIIFVSPGVVATLLLVFQLFKHYEKVDDIIASLVTIMMACVFNAFVLYFIWRKKKVKILRGWQLGAFIMGSIFFISWVIIPSVGKSLSNFVFIFPPVGILFILAILIYNIGNIFSLNQTLTAIIYIFAGTLGWATLGALLGLFLDKFIGTINGDE